MHPNFVICVLHLPFVWYEMESLAVAVFLLSRGMLHNLDSLDICAVCRLSKYRNSGGSRGHASFSLLFFFGCCACCFCVWSGSESWVSILSLWGGVGDYEGGNHAWNVSVCNGSQVQILSVFLQMSLHTMSCNVTKPLKTNLAYYNFCWPYFCSCCCRKKREDSC